MTDTPLFELRGIDKAFGERTVLFEGMDLTVREGEVFTIIGESGTGKTVCLKLMYGLLQPDAGQILYRGKDIGDMDTEELLQMRRNVGYAFQGDALFDSMTVLENIGYALREHTEMSDAEIRARVEETLDMVNLRRNVVDLFPASLSGGMKKRVSLARAIAIKPETMFYDDPTGGLDPQTITAISQTLADLRRDIATSIIVTHDMKTAFSVSDRIAVLSDHRFAHVGTPKELEASDSPVVQDFVRWTAHLSDTRPTIGLRH